MEIKMFLSIAHRNFLDDLHILKCSISDKMERLGNDVYIGDVGSEYESMRSEC
jgi:hypothetical protein